MVPLVAAFDGVHDVRAGATAQVVGVPSESPFDCFWLFEHSRGRHDHPWGAESA